jgi:hypothetical protein
MHTCPVQDGERLMANQPSTIMLLRTRTQSRKKIAHNHYGNALHTGKARSSNAVWLPPNFVNRRPPAWDCNITSHRKCKYILSGYRKT